MKRCKTIIIVKPVNVIILSVVEEKKIAKRVKYITEQAILLLIDLNQALLLTSFINCKSVAHRIGKYLNTGRKHLRELKSI